MIGNQDHHEEVQAQVEAVKAIKRSDDTRRRRWIAGFWFGLAATAGVVFLSLYMGTHNDDWLAIALFFPTTPVGIGGGVGSLYGRTRYGIIAALLAEIVFIHVGFILAFSGDQWPMTLAVMALPFRIAFVVWQRLRKR